MPESIDMFNQLADNGLNIFLLSNINTADYRQLAEQFDFFTRFTGQVISGDIKLAKPDPAIFNHLLETSDLQPHETVFIDDSPENCQAAHALGFHAINFTFAHDCRQQLESITTA